MHVKSSKMLFLLRVLFAVGNGLCLIVNTLVNLLLPRKLPTYPPIQDALLLKSVGELVVELRQKKVKMILILQRISYLLINYFVDHLPATGASVHHTHKGGQ